MTFLLPTLSIVGAIAVITFIVYLVIGNRKGWTNPVARRVLSVSTVAAGACAVLGMLVAFIGD